MNFKNRLLFIPVLVIAGILLFWIFKNKGKLLFDQGQSTIDTVTAEQVITVYNASKSLSKVAPASLKHVYVTLYQFTEERFSEKLSSAIGGKSDVLITVKPISKGNNPVLREILSGGFDNAFKVLFDGAKQHKQQVFLRIMPEMEVPVQTFPWQYQSSAEFAAAFRYFSRLSRQACPDVRIVWGPAGYPGTEEYWPGGDAVDLVSITINSQSENKLNTYPAYPDLQTAVKRKLHRVRFMDKPVMILAESTGLHAAVVPEIEEGIARVQEQRDVIYGAALVRNAVPEPRVSNPVVGVYDPRLALTGLPGVRAEHLFIDLTQIQKGTFERDFNAVMQRGHEAIVSFEPWRDQLARKDTNVLRNTVSGVYDPEFKTLYRILRTANRRVYLRFAHEMEIPIYRYAWQNQDPSLYIKAFRYFMAFREAADTNIRRVWGPAGDRGSMEWWPGEDVVDLVSIAIYGLPDKNITDPKMQESFETIYNRKYHRVHFSGKPIFITEFGVKGPETYKQQWIHEAAGVISAHREIWGVGYFNLVDNPEVWGSIPAPDWSIQKATFNHFIENISTR